MTDNHCTKCGRKGHSAANCPWPVIPWHTLLWAKLKAKVRIRCKAKSGCKECGPLRCEKSWFHFGAHSSNMHYWQGNKRGGRLCFLGLDLPGTNREPETTGQDITETR